uniref:Kazal-like domain-containing protein n=1 Tax=Heliothis virescens TaxID=7102 RepID=A0A2A4JZ28_HELVI
MDPVASLHTVLRNILTIACVLSLNKYALASFCPISYQIIGPVCGTDGVTYPSMCDLEAARLIDDSLDVAQLKPCNDYCNEKWDPICGTDMVTYANLCMFEQGVKVNENLKVFHVGQCLTPIGLLILAQISRSFAVYRGCEGRGPVCGNDGQTYKTLCQLLWAKIDDSDLQVLHDGGCHGEFLFAPAEDGDAVSSRFKEIFENLIQKFQSVSKLSSIMPFGWPPLGPLSPQDPPIPKPSSDSEE